MKPLMPVRPRPHEGESTRGYLMRVAKANGHRTTHTWLNGQGVQAGSTVQRLLRLLALDSAELSKLTGPLPARFGPWPLPHGLVASDFNHGHRRWCPLCLAQEPVLQGVWEIKLTCACPRHSVWLVEQCPQCAARQRWVGADLSHCACGANLAAAEAVSADSIDCAMACLLSGGPCTASLCLNFEDLTVPLRHRFVRLLGLLGDGAMAPRPGQQADLHHLELARRFVMGAARLLEGWPTQFEVQLLLAREKAGMSPSLKYTYGVLYRVLFGDLHDPGFQFVRDAFEEHLHCHWWGMVCRRNGLLKASTVESHPRLSLPRVAQAITVRPSVVRHLVQAQLVRSDAVILKSGRHMTTLHEDEIAPLAELVDGAATLADAARHAALPEWRLKQLIEAGVLRPLVSRPTQRAASWLIAKADLDRLHVRVTSPSGSLTITVCGALKYWRLHAEEATALLSDVIEGRLSAEADIEGRLPVGHASLSRQELRAWLVSMRTASCSAMSIDEAAVLLGIKQQVAYELVGRGFLKASGSDANRRRVTPSDIAAFEGDFVSLADIAKAAKRSSKALLDEFQVRPVMGPCVDGARQYFYRRSDLEAEQALPKTPVG
jgi:TniQ